MQAVSYIAVAAATASSLVAEASCSQRGGSCELKDQRAGFFHGVGKGALRVSRQNRKHLASRRVQAVVTEAQVASTLVAQPSGRVILPSELKVYDVVAKQAALVEQQLKEGRKASSESRLTMGAMPTQQLLADAYARCGEVCAEYAKTFYLGK